MSQPSREPAPRDDRHGGPPPRPAWVRWLVVGLAVAVVLVVVVMLLAGGEHGPGRHVS